jgi:hypothetical protein
MQNITLEQYLDKISHFTDSPYGNIIRGSFRDIQGGSELAMLAAPTKDELQQLKKAVAVMTPAEKTDAAKLTDEQIQKIAADAKVDAGLLAIFLNGYALELRKK